jgi:hypothetical protein
MPVALRWLLCLGPLNPIAVRLVQGGSRRRRHPYLANQKTHPSGCGFSLGADGRSDGLLSNQSTNTKGEKRRFLTILGDSLGFFL